MLSLQAWLMISLGMVADDITPDTVATVNTSDFDTGTVKITSSDL